jgi:hypothetical protein
MLTVELLHLRNGYHSVSVLVSAGLNQRTPIVTIFGEMIRRHLQHLQEVHHQMSVLDAGVT